MSASVAIVDYGVGNLFNIQRAFESVGIESVLTKDKAELLDAERVLLPGVGAFETGIKELERLKLADVLRDFAATGKPMMGICLGMQLLMSESEENGIWPGLNLIEGRVIRFRDAGESGLRFKIPQIGWNTLQYPQGRAPSSWDRTILAGLEQNPAMYFVHSYTVHVEDAADSLATTRYGRDVFSSVIKRKNVSGCQFHPERSGKSGTQILKNFALS